MVVTITNNTLPGKNLRVRVTATDEVVNGAAVAGQVLRQNEAFIQIPFGQARVWDRERAQVAFVKREDNGQTETHYVPAAPAVVAAAGDDNRALVVS